MSAIALSALSPSELQGVHADQICQMADAVCRAANDRGKRMVGGGAWTTQYARTESPDDRVAACVAWRRRAGQRAFIDAPRFELTSAL